MTLSITLVDLKITDIKLDYERSAAIVHYLLLDANGVSWKSGEAIFWATLPAIPNNPDGTPGTQPDNWFLLPSEYFPTLLSLRNDADTALTNWTLV